MRRFAAPILAAPMLAGLLLTPNLWAKSSNKPDLKLIVALDTSAPEQRAILVVQMINESGHSLHIPDPPLLCKPLPGALSLQVKFSPENSGHEQSSPDCDLDVDPSGLPDILERAKSWLAIKPGQVYEARRPLSMGVQIADPGNYEMWVIYTAPCTNPADIERLRQASITVPIGSFSSDRLTYKVVRPKP